MTRRNQIRLMQAVAMLILLAPIGGCNMLAGLGDDISRSARWTQDKLDNGFHADEPAPLARVRN